MPSTELSDHCIVWSAMIRNYSDSEFSEMLGKFVINETSRQKYVASPTDEESTHLLQIFNDVENCDMNLDT